ncbi:hypothetical protein GCM10009624_26540 [Gordonia sinesedis]
MSRRTPDRPAAHPVPAGRPRAHRRASPDEQTRLRRQAAAGRMFVPSALTVLAICAGMSAMRAAANGNVDMAIGLLVAAALLDGVDGRVARLMGATTRIGAEIDSLADAINFGVVPAMIIYFTLMSGEDLGWAMALIYCCAIVLRLARFNTLLDDDDAPAYTRDFFVGVPAPAAAIGVMLPVGLSELFGDGWWTSLPAVGAWLVLMALLAVSRIPTASLKAASVPPRAMAGLLVLVAAGAALLLTYPYALMLIVIGAYIAHIPLAWRNRRWVASRPEHWDTKPAERRAERRAIARAHPRRRPALRRSEARLGLHKPSPRPTGIGRTPDDRDRTESPAPTAPTPTATPTPTSTPHRTPTMREDDAV